MVRRGLVYVFTGEGKGKTSAAMWTAMRAVMAGKRVAVVAWYKEARWPSAEQRVEERVPELRVEVWGKGFFGLPTDHASEEEHRQAAEAALVRARELVEEVEVLVLDEVINAVNDGLVAMRDVRKVVEGRGETHVVLTGRGAGKEWVELADLVTEMRQVKHPFEKGIKAVKGLDF